MDILFFRPGEAYGCFSNLSEHPVRVFGEDWASSEAAYQAAKFLPHRPDVADRIRKAATPHDALEIGRGSDAPVREDWELPPAPPHTARRPEAADDGVPRAGPPEPLFFRTKDLVMYDACSRKFLQNDDARTILLATGEKRIVEASTKDSYWGWGPGKNGHNKLGRILMVVRADLRKWP